MLVGVVVGSVDSAVVSLVDYSAVAGVVANPDGDCIRRQHTFTRYDALAANDAGYTTQQFDSDDKWIRIWLESLEDAA